MGSVVTKASNGSSTLKSKELVFRTPTVGWGGICMVFMYQIQLLLLHVFLHHSHLRIKKIPKKFNYLTWYWEAFLMRTRAEILI
ncbi:hypothetical protein Gorai_007825 [Gossypium raimondii]|uniref:Uncharacterized protein n=1 Tax=Gossypium raimondii TaxID=29730 RepID=A0A7J8Q9V7_GOSRA|nr:hypothetical protein [Gossypium raimondii]